MNQVEQRQGWTPAPNERGTAEIIWSCVATAVLCCWSAVCINVPALHDSEWVTFRRRCSIFFAFLVAPEILAATFFAQFCSARRSVRDFRAAGSEGWTLQQAFFADMGGFLLQTRDWVAFPIDSEQLLWLIKSNYIQEPPIDPSLIKDKNKIDGLARLIMAVQTTWFLINFLARLVSGYAITAIELTTVATIYCTLPIMFLWRHKPGNLAKPEVLQTDVRIEDIVRELGCRKEAGPLGVFIL
ncbi:hypothetical protein F5Y10DRAFT_291995 [Nemania abortiva]|nr:hypothetical protein F5Y10DRAFT_291995 [Nemania abortiva]